MAIIQSKYRAPFLYRNKHIATVIPSIYRQIEVAYQRERLELADGDFLDIDWLGKGRENVIVLTHGLEGDSQRHYMTSIADHFFKKGWGVAAWNCRSCSGEMNRLPRLYSHIDAPDLANVIDYVVADGGNKVAIAGVSMGGAITLNYLSKYQDRHPEQLVGAVAISAPIDVTISAIQLDHKSNKFYKNRFIKKMLKRAVRKEEQFPGLVDLSSVEEINSFETYDQQFTSKLTGCHSLEEFYERANSINYLDQITIPTLLLISGDDPFMTESCYPYHIAEGHKFFHLEVTKHGGHTGFIMNKLRHSWMEIRTYDFVNNLR